VVPFYTLDQDIRLQDGRLLYAKGYSFNPLSYVSLPQRHCRASRRARKLGSADREAGRLYLLAAGNPGDADAITLGERHGRALFLLEARKTRSA
jgi:conjugal transfer pilus assembly protein TraW